MLKILSVSSVAGVIAFTALPVVRLHVPEWGEPATMLLIGSAFFGLASLMRRI